MSLKPAAPQFAAGAVFGGLLATFFHWLASKERIERGKIDQKREVELLKQNALKDNRIEALHLELSKSAQSGKSATTTRNSKAK